MTSRPASDRRVTPELKDLIDYLLAYKGREPYKDLAERSGYSVSTLRRVNRRMPTKKAVKAFAEAVGADEAEALRLLDRARSAAKAAQLAAVRAGRKPYKPGRITKLRGLSAAMERVRAEAGSPSLRALESKSGGALDRRRLSKALKGERLLSAEELEAFLTACHARDQVAAALREARDRLDPGRTSRSHFSGGCADGNWWVHERLERVERGREIRARCGFDDEDEDEEDWYTLQERLAEEAWVEQKVREEEERAERQAGKAEDPRPGPPEE